MSFTREDYDRSLQAKLRATRDARKPELRRLVAAETAMENLTGDVRWDGFLRLVEALRAEALAEAERAEETLRSPDVTAHEPIMAAKIAYARHRAEADVLARVIALPGEIIAEGERAKEALRA